WLAVLVFALAMAWVESSLVFYLRTMLDRIEPYQPNPLPISSGFAKAELVREVATMVMLATVGWLAGRNGRTRFGYFVLAFGVWDIGYYLFLKPLTGWPRTLLDWDVLFLIPLPWWGPVAAPCLIATLMVLFGTLVTQSARDARGAWPRRGSAMVCSVGAALALYVFMADAIGVVAQGETALRQMLPTRFNWPLFVVALMFLAAPIADVVQQMFWRRNTPSAT
ncbi:MAG: hypothetical protein HZA91_15195, partial [Verrucomicrobia bacterium]|nr:hypothetical protein [Verrucomicrobiota bacterium]